jgi:hypothetical protein
MKISWDFMFLVSVIRNSGKRLVVVPSAAELRLIDICLTVTTLKLRSISQFDMSSAGLL